MTTNNTSSGPDLDLDKIANSARTFRDLTSFHPGHFQQLKNFSSNVLDLVATRRALPNGWSLERGGDDIQLRRADGKWCGYSPEIDSPAHRLTHEFLSALLTQQHSAEPAADRVVSRYEGRVQRPDGSWSTWLPIIANTDEEAAAWTKRGAPGIVAEWRPPQRLDIATPPLAAVNQAEAELHRIKAMASTLTAQSFLALSDSDKLDFFASAVEDSIVRKEATEELKRLRALQADQAPAGPALPTGVCWSEQRCDFYHANSGATMGSAFYDQWRDRADEFPSREAARADLAQQAITCQSAAPQPSTRSVLRKLVEIGATRSLTAEEVVFYKKMIEGMETARGLTVAPGPACQLLNGMRLALQLARDHEALNMPAADAISTQIGMMDSDSSPVPAAIEDAQPLAVPEGWKLVKISRLNEIAKLSVDPSKDAYEGRGLYDDRIIRENWQACSSRLDSIKEELHAITEKGWDDEDLEAAIAIMFSANVAGARK